MIWKYFYSKKSGREHGTLYQLRNVLHRTNVSKPDKDFNACDDFFVIIVNSHILAAAFHSPQHEICLDNPTLSAALESHCMCSTHLVTTKELTECKGVVSLITFQFHCLIRRSQ